MKKLLSLLLLLSWAAGLHTAQGGQQGFWYGVPLENLTFLNNLGLPDGYDGMPKAHISYVPEPLKQQIIFGRLLNSDETVEIPHTVYDGAGNLNGGKLFEFIRSVLNLRHSTYYHPDDPRDYFVDQDKKNKINSIVRQFTLGGKQESTFSEPTKWFISGLRKTTFKLAPQPVVPAAAAQEFAARPKEDIVAELKRQGLTVEEFNNAFNEAVKEFDKMFTILPEDPEGNKKYFFNLFIYPLLRYEDLIRRYFNQNAPEFNEYPILGQLLKEAQVQSQPVVAAAAAQEFAARPGL